MLTVEFLAGLIVGEGSYHLAIARDKRRGYLEIRPQFSLRMNDLETMSRVEESLRHHGTEIYRTPGLYHDCRQIIASGLRRVGLHLDVFLPHLTGKKLQAASVVQEFIDRRNTDAFWKRYTEDDVALIERMREINGPSARRLDIGILRDYMRRTGGVAPAVKR